jgi:hypothetical protein
MNTTSMCNSTVLYQLHRLLGLMMLVTEKLNKYQSRVKIPEEIATEASPVQVIEPRST